MGVLGLINAREWHNKLRVENTIKALEKNGFKAIFSSTKDEAVSKILEIISRNALVGTGGSVTLREMELPRLLMERGNKIADHWGARVRGASHDEDVEIRRLQINSDVFITSTNAITENGELVNMDGVGQRVAAMIFGPKKVIVVAGINKIVRDLEEGFWRVRNIASPRAARMRADRSMQPSRKNPCTVTGVCSECNSAERICKVMTVLFRKPSYTDATVILVGENLGF